MYILEPVLHETVWGGKELTEYVKSDIDKLGHLYLVNGHQGMSNKIMNGCYAGKTLREVFEIQKENWNLSVYEEFPLTIALVDATENLSIQVHPDDEAAEKLEKQKIGKNESWVFLKAPNSGWIYSGCECKTKEEVKTAVEQGRMEEITGKLSVGQNDYVCVEEGTLHAMTAGSVVYEIEYGSDFTYRFYDYNRKDDSGNARELHVDKAIEAIKPERVPHVRNNMDSEWISEKYYEIRRTQNSCDYRNVGKEIECISILKGTGSCEGCEISGGMSILLLPGERLERVILDDCIIARIRR